jgi:hypothetical protein
MVNSKSSSSSNSSSYPLANIELILEVTKIHKKLEIELELQRAVLAFPNDLTLVPSPEGGGEGGGGGERMDAKAAKEYWGPKDIGRIEETKEVS